MPDAVSFSTARCPLLRNTGSMACSSLSTSLSVSSAVVSPVADDHSRPASAVSQAA
ncbi:MAG: hypothetical protein KKH51_15910 [Actinobacteria bacterium]|nr:hypothetical protein [Actinomycetota bacterium]